MSKDWCSTTGTRTSTPGGHGSFLVLSSSPATTTPSELVMVPSSSPTRIGRWAGGASSTAPLKKGQGLHLRLRRSCVRESPASERIGRVRRLKILDSLGQKESCKIGTKTR